jgi:VWFA-related protein
MRTLNRFVFSLVLILALMLGSTLTVHAQEPEAPQVRITQVDNSKFPNVTVYLSATNAAGEPVGIDPATIQIFENGQLMQLVDVRGGGEALGGEEVPVTTMLVIDISGSMDKGDKIGAAKEAAKAYINGMRDVDQAGVIAFDTHVYRILEVTPDKAALIAAIDGLQTGSDTAMYEGIMEATRALETVAGRKAILVLSDGLDNQSFATEEEIVNNVGPSGLTVSAIGFGDPAGSGQAGIDEAGLQSLTSRTGGQYVYVTDAASLTAIYQQTGQAYQSEYAVTYVSPSTLRDGINRNLTVALTGSAAVAEDTYNPGGVLPEVSASSWPLFVAILAGILVLLILPTLIGGISGAFRGRKSGSGGLGLGKQAPAARGRIKLK